MGVTKPEPGRFAAPRSTRGCDPDHPTPLSIKNYDRISGPALPVPDEVPRLSVDCPKKSR